MSSFLDKLIKPKPKKRVDVIDSVWIEQEGEWTVFQDDLNHWIEEKGVVECPVCGSTRDDDTAMINVRQEGNIIRCNCGDCGAPMCIIINAPREIN